MIWPYVLVALIFSWGIYWNAPLEKWLRKPIDTLIILAAIFISCIWMNYRFNEINEKLEMMSESLRKEILTIKKIISSVKE
jgi:hypothetical protein